MDFPPKRGEGFSEAAWASCAKGLLYRLIPREKTLIDKVRIEIVPDEKPFAEAESSSKTIYISEGRLILFENEVEFAALLGHELGHIKYNHYSVVSHAYTTAPGMGPQIFFWVMWRFGQFLGIRPFSQTFEEYLFEIETRKEMQADEFMARSLPPELNAASIFADTLERFMRTSGMLDTPDEPCARMHRARIACLRKLEQENNTRAPH